MGECVCVCVCVCVKRVNDNDKGAGLARFISSMSASAVGQATVLSLISVPPGLSVSPGSKSEHTLPVRGRAHASRHPKHTPHIHAHKHHTRTRVRT